MRKSFLRWALAGLMASSLASGATLELLKDIGDNDVLAGSSPVPLGALGGRGYFAATPFGGAPTLYRTDGTPESTVPVAAGRAINRPGEGREIAGRLAFFAQGNSDRPKELWTTDGTDGGTVRIQDSGDFGSSYVWMAVRRDSHGFFYQSGGGSGPLFVTDGTASGTRLLLDRQVSGIGSQPFDADGNFYFWSTAPGSSDSELWRSDGTVAGTRKLIARSDIALTSLGRLMHLSGDTALVSGDDDVGRGVFLVDLVSGAITRLSNLTHLVTSDGIHAGSLHYFHMGAELWRTDGTPAGTFALTNGGGVGDTLLELGGRVLFTRLTSGLGEELWSTDGTLAGTALVKESTPGSSGSMILVLSTGSRAFYLAGDPGTASVRIWSTDGTSSGTNPIPLGGSTTYNLSLGNFNKGFIAGNRVYLMLDQLAPGSGGWYPALFATDLAGSSAVDLGPGTAAYDPVAIGESLLFSNVLDPSGSEPWFTDGTPAGTRRLRDIAVSGQTNSADPKDFTPLGNRALFVADDGDTGRELWITDGTEAGTMLVKNIAPGAGSSTPSGLRNVGGIVYFAAGNGSVSDGGGGRLWRSDGTAEGTFPLGEARAVVGGGSTGGCASWSTLFNGRAWFFGQGEIYQGAELWSTDGTEAGTRFEFLLPEETRYWAHCELHTTANGMIFIQDTAPDTQFWRSDGTLQGTVRIPNVRPAGVTSGFASMSAPITVVNGIAYLLADGGDGLEPWRSDGTTAGTRQVEDLTPGVLGAQGYAATPLGDGIVFRYASEPGDKDGLWRISSTTSGADRIKEGWITGNPVTVGARVFFQFNDSSSTESLWVTSGTTPGTLRVFSASTGSSLSMNDVLAGDGVLFFTGDGKLWSTTGAAGAPRGIADLPGYGVVPSRAVLLAGRPLLVFDTANRGVEPYIMRNAAPVAVADTATVASGGNVLVNVRANDTDPDSAVANLTVTVVVPPTNGSAIADAGSIRYTPVKGFTGTDTFQYRLTDEFGSQSEAVTVTVTVSATPAGGGGGGQSGGGGGGGSFDLLLLGLLAWACWVRARGFERL